MVSDKPLVFMLTNENYLPLIRDISSEHKWVLRIKNWLTLAKDIASQPIMLGMDAIIKDYATMKRNWIKLREHKLNRTQRVKLMVKRNTIETQ